MPFKRGVVNNPNGRPRGPRKHKWADMAYWGMILEDNQDDLTPKERIELAKWAMELLADKRKDIPKMDAGTRVMTPADMLKSLEAQPSGLGVVVDKPVRRPDPDPIYRGTGG